MDLRHQSSAMCIIMLGGERRHTPVVCNKSREPHEVEVVNNAFLTLKAFIIGMSLVVLGKNSGRFGKNMAANVSAKKYAETSQAKKLAETSRMIYAMYARSPSPSQRPAPTTIASRSPFPLGLCSCSTSFSKMGI